MNNEEYLKKLHHDLLEILDQITFLCEKHDLKYYLVGGTLLGAVRHKGFIPWDDDLDIAVPRADFNRFIEICENELPDPFRLKWITNTPDYYQVFAKVYNSQTLFIEDLGNEKVTDSGIFVDIFPLDETGVYNKEIEFRKWLVSRSVVAMGRKTLKNTPKLHHRIICALFSNRTINKFAEIIMSFSNGKGYSYYSNFGSQYPIKHQNIPKCYYGEGLLLPFEDRHYVCPEQYNKVLSSIYGENYMQLPPKERQRTHYPLKVIFSDQTKIEFEKTNDRISIIDQ